MSLPKKDRLVAQTTGAVEILKSTTVAIAKVEVAPSVFPSITASLIGLMASYLFWSQGEADAHAPALMGLGLAILWRLRNEYWWNAISRWLYLALFALFLIERAPAHNVFIEGNWVEVSLSPGLYLCGASSLLVGLSAWLIHAQSDPSFSSSKQHNKAESYKSKGKKV